MRRLIGWIKTEKQPRNIPTCFVAAKDKDHSTQSFVNRISEHNWRCDDGSEKTGI